MSWHIYAANGQRAERCPDPAWNRYDPRLRDWLGFRDSVMLWRPTWFAARMSHGWRLFELDVGMVVFVHRASVADWWQPAAPEHRRFPSIAALEMWIRHVGVRT